MVSFSYTSSLVHFLAAAVTVQGDDLLTDITKIQRYWGQLSPYADNAENYFGVENVGLPDGCQIVRVFLSGSPKFI